MKTEIPVNFKDTVDTAERTETVVEPHDPSPFIKSTLRFIAIGVVVIALAMYVTKDGHLNGSLELIKNNEERIESSLKDIEKSYKVITSERINLRKERLDYTPIRKVESFSGGIIISRNEK